ncbi:MAG: hypothetical protein HQ541_15825 [Mariniphaga sp.]|nr:hypothetical protein [Mariniphaga sp.]
MKNILKIISILVVAALFLNTSCKVGEFNPGAQGDARIITLVTPNDTLFGLGLYAYTTGQFYSVSAYYTGATSGVYNLEPFNNSTYDYYYETPIEEMTGELPDAGEYIFDVEFKEGEFKTVSDYLTDEFVLPPFITLCEFNTDIDRIAISWANIVDEGLLKFNVYNQQRELLYASSSIDKSAIIFTFGYNSNTWEIEESPEVGEELILEIVFYTFELINGGALNTQAVGIIEKTITWGG